VTDASRQVLEMLAAGKITTDEADRLLNALREPGRTAPPSEKSESQPKPRYLRVIVDANDEKDGPTKINIRVPLQLLRAGVRLASFMPVSAQAKVNVALQEQGIDLDISKIKPENIDELLAELRDTSIDVTQKGEDVKIRIFSE
jgi:hypothetical protein